MKLIVVTAYYAPFIHPRAHRWTVITRQWTQMGHEVTVLTARVAGAEDPEGPVRVYRVGFDSLKEWVYHIAGVKTGRGRVGAPPRPPGWAEKALQGLYRMVWKNLYFPDDACLWYFPAKKALLKLLKNERYDALITVSLPFTGHLLGLAAQRRYPDVHWLADIGDPFAFQAAPPNNRFLYGRLNRYWEKKVLETAAGSMVTTDTAVDLYRRVFGDSAVRNMRVAPPLYQALPNPLAPVALDASRWNIGYFGAMYAPTRTPDLLLSLVDRMLEQRPAWQERFTLHFFGEVFPEFYAALASRPYVVLHGLRPREEVRQAMHQMDVLLNIGNITGFQLPSKAVDYLAAGKPVWHLSFVPDDPFTAIFRENDLIFVLDLKNGEVAETDFHRCMDWLENPPEADPEAGKRAVAPYLAERVAALYLDFIGELRHG